MTNQISLALGLLTLIGSQVVGFSMERSGVRALTPDQRRHLSRVKRETRLFRTIALGLLAAYVVLRLVFSSARPDWNHASVLCLWTSYNIVLWIKMRRIMRAFGDEALPINFQISYLFAQIIAYTGLVSAMLVMLHGHVL